MANPVANWVSPVRASQTLQNKIDKSAIGPRPRQAVGKMAAASDRYGNILDDATASDDRAEAKVNRTIDTFLKNHTAGMTYDQAVQKVADTGILAQALQKQQIEVNQMGEAKWNEAIKTDPALATINANANKSDPVAMQMRSNHMKIMGIQEYQAKSAAGEKGVHYTAEKLADIDALVARGMPHHGAAVKEVQDYFRTMLDDATADGRISKELNATLKNMYDKYVPINRILDAIQDGNPWGSTQPGSLSKQQTVKKLSEGGSDLATEDMWKSLVTRTFQDTREASRNKVGREFERVATLYPGWDKLIYRVSPQDIEAGRFKPTDNNHVNFLEDGRKVTLAVPDVMAMAAKQLTPRETHVAITVMKAGARLLRATATGLYNPPFQAANLVRDIWTNAINTGSLSLLKAPQATGEVIASTLGIKKWSKNLDRLREGGGAFISAEQFRNRPRTQIDYMIAKSREGVTNKLTSVGKYAATNKKEASKQFFSWLEDVASKSEEMGRLRVYLDVKATEIKAGKSLQEAEAAAFEAARNQMANYRRVGSKMGDIVQVTPYLNAAIEGTASSWDTLKNDPAKFAARTAFWVVMPQIAATIYNLSSPDRQKQYADTPDHELDDNIAFMSGDGLVNEDGKHWMGKIPLAQPFNNLSRPIRMAIETMWRDDPASLQSIADDLGINANFAPATDPKYATQYGTAGDALETMLDTINPQLFKVVSDIRSGTHQFSGRPFVSKKLEGLPETEQIDKDTSKTVTALAQAAGASPAKWQGRITAGGGQGIPLGLNALDWAGTGLGLLPEGKSGGVNTPTALKNRFVQGRGGRVKDIDLTEARAKQDVSYQGLSAELTPAHREVLKQFGMGVPPVKPLVGDTDAVIAIRQQLKGRMIRNFMTDAMNDPSWARMTAAQQKEVLDTQVAKRAQRFLGRLTTRSGKLDPSRRADYWQRMLDLNPQ